MKVEIELKMRLTDRVALEQKLRQSGAQHQSSVLESNTYFDNAEGELKSSDRGLRLRRITGSDNTSFAQITYKGPRAHGKFKSRLESELRVDDARTAAELLTSLGFFPALSFEKKRDTWLLDDCLVELDTLPHLGQFVEIEGASEQAVAAARHKLGLDDQPVLRASYIAMMMTYVLENRISDRVIGFE